jgi:hypothetical protein
VETGARWVQEASTILANTGNASASAVRRQYQRWVGQLERSCRGAAMSAPLREAAAHFIKVTRSYGEGLFHCYRIANLPRTNNALEQAFGSLRYHERRASGRKVASPSLVLNGCVRMATAAATRTRIVTRDMLASVPPARWRATRADLERRRQARCLRFRFRKNPSKYLAGLEEACGKLIVPS